MKEDAIRQLLAQAPTRGERALFDAYYNYVYAIVFARLHGTGTREDVEECVVDTFYDVLAHFEDIRPGSLRAYIGTVARNKAVNAALTAARRRGRQLPLDETLVTETMADTDPASDVAARTEDAETAARIVDAILSLGEPDAAILLQKFYYGRNAAEIARVLKMKPATVRSRCARALKKLRPLLEDLR